MVTWPWELIQVDAVPGVDVYAASIDGCNMNILVAIIIIIIIRMKCQVHPLHVGGVNDFHIVDRVGLNKKKGSAWQQLSKPQDLAPGSA